MTWIVDYEGQDGVTFSKIFRKNEAHWVDIYDWCNSEFNAKDWNFWYDSTKADPEAIIANFEFLQEYDAVQFQLTWG